MLLQDQSLQTQGWSMDKGTCKASYITESAILSCIGTAQASAPAPYPVQLERSLQPPRDKGTFMPLTQGRCQPHLWANGICGCYIAGTYLSSLHSPNWVCTGAPKDGKAQRYQEQCLKPNSLAPLTLSKAADRKAEVTGTGEGRFVPWKS